MFYFILELKPSPFSAATSLDVDSASDLYNTTLSRILDKMIPFKTLEDLLIHGLSGSVVLRNV